MASFFEKMQWHVRADTSISDQPPIFDQLPVSLSDFTREEILHVISKLQKKKVPDTTAYQQSFGLHVWVHVHVGMACKEKERLRANLS
jgi:hypothetical protein